MSIVSLFCEIHDFFMMSEAYHSTHCLPSETTPEPRGRPRQLHPSEVMTILIAFHQSGYRTFKHFYQRHVCVYYRAEFPRLVSYSRFVQLKQEMLTLLTSYLSAKRGICGGVSFIDATRLCVCDNKRISSHRVFAKTAERSKTSMGWFYGFKLHLIINDEGSLLRVDLTPGNIDDRHLVEKLSHRLEGSLYGDRGYISKDLRQRLRQRGINYVYKVRKNMDPLPLSVSDEVFLKKRGLIESVIKEFKTQTQLEHTRHRSFENFQVNGVSALIAYQLLETKPSLNLHELQQINDLPLRANH